MPEPLSSPIPVAVSGKAGISGWNPSESPPAADPGWSHPGLHAVEGQQAPGEGREWVQGVRGWGHFYTQ